MSRSPARGTAAAPITVSSDSSSDDVSEIGSVLAGPVPTTHRIIRLGYCRICGANAMDLMFYPCFHASVCHKCYERFEEPKRCPMCTARVTKTELFFL
jgi:hypothetical protein